MEMIKKNEINKVHCLELWQTVLDHLYIEISLCYKNNLNTTIYSEHSFSLRVLLEYHGP